MRVGENKFDRAIRKLNKGFGYYSDRVSRFQ